MHANLADFGVTFVAETIVAVGTECRYSRLLLGSVRVNIYSTFYNVISMNM